MLNEMYVCECGGTRYDNGEDLICETCGSSYMEHCGELEE
jgi:hypothetical protein